MEPHPGTAPAAEEPECTHSPLPTPAPTVQTLLLQSPPSTPGTAAAPLPGQLSEGSATLGPWRWIRRSCEKRSAQLCGSSIPAPTVN
ncbi:hypothetical protein GCM10009663_70490 [Kitasatospora arboriphila]|uniref:Uncharacterized protein n=1 Tax=Kitasatospora arboriphila TaxID=258052 RepID=A0ABN1U7Y9_9ACTN